MMVVTEEGNYPYWGWKIATKDKALAEFYKLLLKRKGYKSSKSGISRKILAVSEAKAIEHTTGVEMHVFRHGYRTTTNA